MTSPHFHQQIARQRASELIRAAERERLARSLRRDAPHPLERLLDGLVSRLARRRRAARGLPAPHPTRPIPSVS
jgi:hypothetical protein